MPRVKIQKGHELITIVVRANVANCMIDMASARATIKQTMIAMRWRCICLSWCMCVYVCVCVCSVVFLIGICLWWCMCISVYTNHRLVVSLFVVLCPCRCTCTVM